MSLVLPKRPRQVALGILSVSAFLALSGCSAEDKTQIKRLAMPESATKQAPMIYDLWIWAWVAAIITGVIVWGLIFYAVLHFRRRRADEIPVQTRYNLPIEVFYTVAPIMMVIVFFFFTVHTQDTVLQTEREPDTTVTVVGQQWSWTFNYNVGYDDSSGSYKTVGGEQAVHESGTTAQRPTLWLVKDKTVKFYLFSPDVIHSFWVPAFLFKMDVVPGRHNNFEVTPNRTGTFQGRCAELCGVYHSRMLFNVKVVDQAAYDAHLRSLASQGNTGPALGGSEVSSQPGLESNGGE